MTKNNRMVCGRCGKWHNVGSKKAIKCARFTRNRIAREGTSLRMKRYEKNRLKTEEKMKQTQLPRKHASKPVNDEQMLIIEKIKADKKLRTFVEAKHEYFENQDKYESAPTDEPQKKEKELDQGLADVAEEVMEEIRKKRACMTVSEAKLGVTLVLTKGDIKAMGFNPDQMTTKAAIMEVRAKLGLPEKSFKD